MAYRARRHFTYVRSQNDQNGTLSGVPVPQNPATSLNALPSFQHTQTIFQHHGSVFKSAVTKAPKRNFTWHAPKSSQKAVQAQDSEKHCDEGSQCQAETVVLEQSEKWNNGQQSPVTEPSLQNPVELFQKSPSKKPHRRTSETSKIISDKADTGKSQILNQDTLNEKRTSHGDKKELHLGISVKVQHHESQNQHLEESRSVQSAQRISSPKYKRERKNQLLRLSNSNVGLIQSTVGRNGATQAQNPQTNQKKISDSSQKLKSSQKKFLKRNVWSRNDPVQKLPQAKLHMGSESLQSVNTGNQAKPFVKLNRVHTLKKPESKNTPQGYTRGMGRSLLRKTSILSAVKKTIESVRNSSPRISPSRNLSLGGRRIFSIAKSQQKLMPSPFNKKAVRSQRTLEKFTWRREQKNGNEVSESVSNPVKKFQVKQFGQAAKVIKKGSKSQGKVSKLVRMGGNLYKVSGTGAGKTLKRQNTPRAVKIQKSPRKTQYARKGNSLHRLLTGTPMKSLPMSPIHRPLFANFRDSMRRKSLLSLSSISASKKQTTKRPLTKGKGLIAQIRKRTKFTNKMCPEYCRTGICGARNAGDCVKIHDPSKIAVCPSWLLGQCRKSNCPLQHKRQEDLMPTCIHFLRGSCSNANCPYLHVKLDKNAPVCREFLEGYCPRGSSCPNKHLTKRMVQESRAQKSSKFASEGQGNKLDEKSKLEANRKRKNPDALEIQNQPDEVNLMLPSFLREL